MLKTSKIKTTQFRYTRPKNEKNGNFAPVFNVKSVENTERNCVVDKNGRIFTGTEKCSDVENEENSRCCYKTVPLCTFGVGRAF